MGFFRRIGALGRRSKLDSEIDAELRAHLAMRADDNIAAGMTPKEAARDARLRFGNPTVMRERVTATDAALILEGLWTDLQYVLRQLRRSPGFALTAVLTLALGIGANTTFFSLINTLLIKPLPYAHSERLVMVWEQLRALRLNRFEAPIGDYADYRKDNHVFTDIAAIENAHYVLAEGEFPERIFAMRVTANLFGMMGLRPMLGRTFIDADNKPDHAQVAILSNALWRERFGGDAGVLSRRIVLDGKSYEIVGVMQPDVLFSVGYPQPPAVWVPLPVVSDPQRQIGNLQLVARLRDGVTIQAAQADMDTVARQLEQAYHIQMGPHGEDPGYGIEVVPLREELVGNLREPLLLMFGAAGFILLIACTNVANLMLTNGVSREREFAVRISLGASRTRLVRLLIMQAFLLAVLGEAAGLAVSTIASRLLLRFSPYEVAKLFGSAMDLHVLIFASCATIVAMVLFAILPVWRIVRRNSLPALQSNANQVLSSRAGKHLRQALVVAETAISVALVIGAGLLIHSFLRMRQTPLGFNPNGVFTSQISLPPAYATATQQRQFVGNLLDHLRSMPNVDAVATTTMLPVANRPEHDPFSIEGRAWQPFGAESVAQFSNYQAVSTDYFRAMQIALREGRLMNDADREDSQPVALVNETMVRGFWPGMDPIGRHLMLGAPQPGNPWLTIVGVVADVRSGGANADVVPEIYTPVAQAPGASMALVIRMRQGNPANALNVAQSALAAVDRSLPLHDTATYEEILAQQSGPRRYEMFLIGSFGGLALLLAAVGLYGVVSYSVAQRTREMGLRMAFGATAESVMALVLRQALVLTGAGLILGAGAALLLRQVLSSALFGIHFVDPPVYIAVAFALLLVSLAAAYLPARRAATVDPIVALRCE